MRENGQEKFACGANKATLTAVMNCYRQGLPILADCELIQTEVWEQGSYRRTI